MPVDDQHHVRVRRGARIVLGIGLLLLLPGILAFANNLGFAMRAQRAEASFEGAVERNTSYGVMFAFRHDPPCLRSIDLFKVFRSV